MGNRISIFSCSSRGNSTAKITDSSIWYPQQGQHISIRTFRELNRAPTSSPISTRTEMFLNGELSRSTDDLQGEDNRQPTTLTQRQLTQEVSRRLLM
uniref:C4 n=2 Tax=Tomato yellow leaf curl Sardinia virus TaxID=123735 RepID=A0A2S1XBL3_TYCSV|nr:C4 protein [Tomato yellow leaf curl Sardinia virus]AWV66956.1 C4 [Tomato yellow leaf curl Sardinia virus]AXK15518.1 C4 [Tomato yellow leaf curl Sardinia virus]CAA82240.1 C4 [Tomato yellow leaf curl Sardinia virus-[Sicily]]